MSFAFWWYPHPIGFILGGGMMYMQVKGIEEFSIFTVLENGESFVMQLGLMELSNWVYIFFIRIEASLNT